MSDFAISFLFACCLITAGAAWFFFCRLQVEHQENAELKEIRDALKKEMLWFKSAAETNGATAVRLMVENSILQQRRETDPADDADWWKKDQP